MSDRFNEPESPEFFEPGPEPPLTSDNEGSGECESRHPGRTPSLSPPEKRSPAEIVADALRNARWQVAEGPKPNRPAPDSVGKESSLPHDHEWSGRTLRGLADERHDEPRRHGDEHHEEACGPTTSHTAPAPGAHVLPAHPDALMRHGDRIAITTDAIGGPGRAAISGPPEVSSGRERPEDPPTPSVDPGSASVHGIAPPALAQPAVATAEDRNRGTADSPPPEDHRPNPRQPAPDSGQPRIDGIAPPALPDMTATTDRVPVGDDPSGEVRLGVVPDSAPLARIVEPHPSDGRRAPQSPGIIGPTQGRAQGLVRPDDGPTRVSLHFDPVHGLGNESRSGPGEEARNDNRIALDPNPSRPGGYTPPVLSDFGSGAMAGPAPGHPVRHSGSDSAGSSSHSFGFEEAAHGPQAGGTPASDLTRTNDLLQQLVELVRKDRSRSLPGNDRRNNYSL